MEFLPLKQRVNRDKKGFATKQRMFGLLIIDEGPSLSMTDGRAVAHFKLVWCPALRISRRWSRSFDRLWLGKQSNSVFFGAIESPLQPMRCYYSRYDPGLASGVRDWQKVFMQL